MANKKKCFVISPIGDETSDVRKESDALLWVASNALEKFNFEVIRVDQIARSTVITNEIIQLIQEAELCLIVLTGENPNVFYEAGRRHETGKPFIQLIRKGERIPFDVASIRTIVYDDIQSLSSAAKVVAEIQRFVNEFEKGGYGASGTGVSMSTIASALDRIERKMGKIMSNSITSSPASLPNIEGINLYRTNPYETFISSISRGDTQKAISLLPAIEKKFGDSSTELLLTAGLLSSQGFEPAFEIVYRILSEQLDKIAEENIDTVVASVGSIVQFYIAANRPEEGIERCGPIIEQVMSLPSIKNSHKANILNQNQMLLYVARKYQEALNVCEKVLEYDSSIAAYFHNMAVILEELGLLQKAVELIDKCLLLDDVQAPHLSKAIELYIETGRISDAKNTFMKLQEVDADKAAFLIFRDDIRQALQT